MARNKSYRERSAVWDFIILISITSTFLMRSGQGAACAVVLQSALGQAETAHSSPVRHRGTQRDMWASLETSNCAHGVGQEGEGPWGWGAAQGQCSVCLPQHSGSSVVGTGVLWDVGCTQGPTGGTSGNPHWLLAGSAGGTCITCSRGQKRHISVSQNHVAIGCKGCSFSCLYAFSVNTCLRDSRRRVKMLLSGGEINAARWLLPFELPGRERVCRWGCPAQKPWGQRPGEGRAHRHPNRGRAYGCSPKHPLCGRCPCAVPPLLLGGPG